MSRILGLDLSSEEERKLLSIEYLEKNILTNGIYTFVLPYQSLIYALSILDSARKHKYENLRGFFSRDDYRIMLQNRNELQKIIDEVNQVNRDRVITLIAPSDKILKKLLVGNERVGLLPDKIDSIDSIKYWWLFGKPIVVE